MKKSIFLIILTVVFILPLSFLWSQNSIQKGVDAMMNETDLKNASLSFRVIDLESDSVLAFYNPNTSLTPASTMKIVSTAAAIANLGSYKTFETILQYDGYIDTTTHILNGNIYIKGGGDPTLGSKYFLSKNEEPAAFFNDWVKAVKELGIDSITGRIIGDETYFSQEMIPSTWTWGDIGNYYGAGPSGLTIYDNLLEVSFSSGKKAGDATTVECIYPYLPNVTFYNEVKASNDQKDNAYIFSAPYDAKNVVTGTIPKAEENFVVKGTIYDPPYQAAYDFEYFLLVNGIKVGKNASTIRRLTLTNEFPKNKRTDFFAHISPSLARIAYWTNHVSINLFAEHLLNQVGVALANNGSNSAGANAVENFWKKHVGEGMYVSDGSGLSRHNAISAHHLTEILKYMSKSKYYESFYSSLPIAGKSGTLKSIGNGTSAENNVRAKSGTMTRVKSYAGYCTTKSGKKVAFAIIINNYNCNTSTVTNKLEKLMVAIANYNG